MPTTIPPLADLLDPIRDYARRAGAVIMTHYQPGGMGDDVEAKGDGSPVTAADREAEAIITPLLNALTPEIPVIGEEAASAGDLPEIKQGPFWLVDPLDGTKGFIKGSGEFTVNIALIVDQRPVLGVIYAPAFDEEFGGYGIDTAFMKQGDGADQPISVTSPPPAKVRVTASKNHRNQSALDAFLAGREVADCDARSSSLKFCEVAAGRADIYPRFGPTCEWDTAAGHAILEAAGGLVTDVNGGPFEYGKADRKVLNDSFIAWGGTDPAEWFAKTGS